MRKALLLCALYMCINNAKMTPVVFEAVVNECDTSVKIECLETWQILGGAVNYYDITRGCLVGHTRHDKHCYLSQETLVKLKTTPTSSGGSLSTDNIWNDSCFTDTETVWYRLVEAKDKAGNSHGVTEANIVHLNTASLRKFSYSENLVYTIINDTCLYCGDNSYCTSTINLQKENIDLTQRCLMRRSYIQLFYHCDGNTVQVVEKLVTDANTKQLDHTKEDMNGTETERERPISQDTRVTPVVTSDGHVINQTHTGNGSMKTDVEMSQDGITSQTVVIVAGSIVGGIFIVVLLTVTLINCKNRYFKDNSSPEYCTAQQTNGTDMQDTEQHEYAELTSNTMISYNARPVCKTTR